MIPDTHGCYCSSSWWSTVLSWVNHNMHNWGLLFCMLFGSSSCVRLAVEARY